MKTWIIFATALSAATAWGQASQTINYVGTNCVTEVSGVQTSAGNGTGAGTVCPAGSLLVKKSFTSWGCMKCNAANAHPERSPGGGIACYVGTTATSAACVTQVSSAFDAQVMVPNEL